MSGEAGPSRPSPQRPSIPSGQIQWPSFANCVVCEDRKDKNVPRIQHYGECDFMHLKCFHFVCSRACLQSIIDVDLGMGSSPACPVCNLKFDPHEVVKRTCRPLEMIQAVPRTPDRGMQPIVLCTYCPRRDEGVAWCDACAEVLCRNCEDYHRQNRATHDHIIVRRTETVRKEGDEVAGTVRPCEKHTNQILNRFCEDCDVRLCIECKKSDDCHSGHKICTVKQLVKKTREKMDSNLRELGNIEAAGIQTDRLLNEKRSMLITAERHVLLQQAKQNFSRILEALVKKEAEIWKGITETTLRRAQELKVKLVTLKSSLLQSENCKNIMRTLVDCTDDDIILEWRHINSYCNELRRKSQMFMKESRRCEFVEEGSHFMIDSTAVAEIEALILDMGKMVYTHRPGSKVHERLYAHHAAKIKQFNLDSEAAAKVDNLSVTLNSQIAGEHSPFNVRKGQGASSDILAIHRSLNGDRPMTSPLALSRPPLALGRPASSVKRPMHVDVSRMKIFRPQKSILPTATSFPVEKQFPCAQANEKTSRKIGSVSPFKVNFVSRESVPSKRRVVEQNATENAASSISPDFLKLRPQESPEFQQPSGTFLLGKRRDPPPVQVNGTVPEATDLVSPFKIPAIPLKYAQKRVRSTEDVASAITGGGVGTYFSNKIIRLAFAEVEKQKAQNSSSGVAEKQCSLQSSAATDSVSESNPEKTSDEGVEVKERGSAGSDFDKFLANCEVSEDSLDEDDDDIIMDFDYDADNEAVSRHSAHRNCGQEEGVTYFLAREPNATSTDAAEFQEEQKYSNVEASSVENGVTDGAEVVNSLEKQFATTSTAVRQEESEKVAEDTSPNNHVDGEADSRNKKNYDKQMKEVGKQGETTVDTQMPSTSAMAMLRDAVSTLPKVSSAHKEDMPSPEVRQISTQLSLRGCITLKKAAQEISSDEYDDESTSSSATERMGQVKRSSVLDYSSDSFCGPSRRRQMNWNIRDATLGWRSSSGVSKETRTEGSQSMGVCGKQLSASTSCLSDTGDSREKTSGRKRGRPKGSGGSKKNAKGGALQATEMENYCDVCCTGGDEVLMCCDEFKCRRVFHVKCYKPPAPINAGDASSAAPKSISTRCIWCASRKEATEIEDINDRVGNFEEAWDEFGRNRKGMISRPDELQHASYFLSEIYKLGEGIRVRFIAERLHKSGNRDVLDFRGIWLKLFGNSPSKTSFSSVTELLDTLKETLDWHTALFTGATDSERTLLQQFRESVEDLKVDFYSSVAVRLPSLL